MDTITTLNEKILNITMKIRNEHPELMKYLSEMPITIPEVKHPDIDLKILNDYYSSLKTMVNKYTNNQQI